MVSKIDHFDVIVAASEFEALILECSLIKRYLPKYNIAIECQGEQHFMPVKYFGGEDAFNKRKELDALKYKLSINNNVKILYYSHNKYNDDIITDTDMLLDIIKTRPIRDN